MMDEHQLEDEPLVQPLRLRMAVLFYAFGCGLLYLAWVFLSGGLIFLVYLAIGVALNHLVLKRLIEWHPMYNTLSNVANAKLSAVLFWPFSYLVLFVQLVIAKLL